MMKNKMIIIISTVVILAVGLYTAADRIAIYVLSRAFNLEIKYAGLKRSGIMQFDIKGLTCLDKARGFGIFSERSDIKPDLKKMAIDFGLSNVRFIKRSPEPTAALDSLSKMVEEPFKGNWDYRRMSGSVRMIRGGLEIVRFDAEGEDMRISLKGSILRDGAIRSDIVIFFSSKLAEKIPEELASVLLTDEGGGWKGLSVSLSGDYRSPSIQVTGKLFRLSVKEIVEVK